MTVFPLGELTGAGSDDAGDGNHRDALHSVTGLAPISASGAPDGQLDVARRFLFLADLDKTVFERLGRYEASLWRQVRQTLFVLERLRWRTPSAHRWRTQQAWQRTMAPLPDVIDESAGAAGDPALKLTGEIDQLFASPTNAGTLFKLNPRNAPRFGRAGMMSTI